MITVCEKIVPTATDLASVVGGAELNDDADKAREILKTAHETLEADYSGSGTVRGGQQQQQQQQHYPPPQQQPRKSG